MLGAAGAAREPFVRMVDKTVGRPWSMTIASYPQKVKSSGNGLTMSMRPRQGHLCRQIGCQSDAVRSRERSRGPCCKGDAYTVTAGVLHAAASIRADTGPLGSMGAAAWVAMWRLATKGNEGRTHSALRGNVTPVRTLNRTLMKD